MNKAKLAEAKRHAREFLIAVQAFEAEAERNEYAWQRSSKAATVKRRSMDLTKSLAYLRKSDWEENR